MIEINLSAQKREVLGKKVATLRRQGSLPAVLYGKEFDALPVTISAHEFEKVFKQAGTSTIFLLKINGEEHDVLVKELERDPVTQQPCHVDFYRIKKGERIRVTIPLVFTEEAPAIKELGGVLVTSKDEIEIECLPKDLPRQIAVSLADLTEIDSAIHIKDIIAPAGVEILDGPDELVAVITAKKEEEEEKVILEEEAVAAVEVEGEKKEEGAEREEKETERKESGKSEEEKED